MRSFNLESAIERLIVAKHATAWLRLA